MIQQQPPMEDKNRDDGERDPMKFLLEESLVRQRNEMMDNFSHILRRFPIVTKETSTNSHFEGAMPFKVQFNFDIPLFEGNIDIDALEKLLGFLEGYLSFQKFSNSEKIIFVLLKVLSHVKFLWDTYCEQHVEHVSAIFSARTYLGSFF
jgi:hypothetical protein